MILEYTFKNDMSKLHEELLQLDFLQGETEHTEELLEPELERVTERRLSGRIVGGVPEVVDFDLGTRETGRQRVREIITVREPKLRVEGLGDSVKLTVPDDADARAIEKVVKAHAP